MDMARVSSYILSGICGVVVACVEMVAAYQEVAKKNSESKAAAAV